MFPLYYNSDGSVGKVYKLDNDEATVKVNDVALIPLIDKLHKEWIKEADNFHQKLLSLNVKAYRFNDGWVDRKNCRIYFHDNDYEKGSYWYDSKLNVGDKIFIGIRYSGGRFVEIISSNNNLHWHEYEYKPLPKTLDSFVDGKPYLTKYTVEDKLSWWKRLFGNYHLQPDIYGEIR